ncbi:MAG: iron-sulfur cluster assembly accessory protein [Francisellaceae bacterium]|mgnify:CR=1 FL=1|jgi:iron-sulfur cluster assembly protein|nr:iron-sulfur cluster assembly accessory protein [Francisellaceae bacterium]MBT6206994.1 iron-sulfur cluster assembly accessory protein [Francisellaceae bacterium]MBT6539217.1 iron-sulfur cluster assembly accessory protein [Francisellaceae bacterium]
MSNINISDSAKNHFKKSLADVPDAIGIRLGLKKAGCSGYAYYIDLAKDIKDNEIKMEVNGITLYVDEQYIDNHLSGTTIDYQQEGVNSFLKFKNPNVENECGCGESVHFKEKE